LLVTEGADGLVTGAQAAELGQVGGGAGEGPTGPGQGQQLAGLRADEALDAQAVVQRIAAGAATGADAVEALQTDVASGGQDVAPGGAFVPQAVPACTGPAGRPFFSTASAWACSAAWTAWRASSRPAGTARASIRARTWPSGAA